MDRREFLVASPMAVAALVTEPGFVKGESEVPAAPDPGHTRDYWNDLPNRMASQMAAARVRRKSDLAKVKSTAAAADRIALIRSRVWECIGGEPDQTSLNPVITGVIEREKYRIEKVVFEGQPGRQTQPGLPDPLSKPCLQRICRTGL
jgi:hypothetical protein